MVVAPARGIKIHDGQYKSDIPLFYKKQRNHRANGEDWGQSSPFLRKGKERAGKPRAKYSGYAWYYFSRHALVDKAFAFRYNNLCRPKVTTDLFRSGKLWEPAVPNLGDVSLAA